MLEFGGSFYCGIEMGKKQGRPTKWSPEVEARALWYVREGWKTEGDAIPSVCGLAVVLGLNKCTLEDWRTHDNKNFSGILAELLMTQERVLLNQGLLGNYNSNLTKLVLGKHGYHDRVEQEVPATKSIGKIEIEVVGGKAKSS